MVLCFYYNRIFKSILHILKTSVVFYGGANVNFMLTLLKYVKIIGGMFGILKNNTYICINN